MFLLNVSTDSYSCQEISIPLALPQRVAYFLKIKYIGKRKLGKWKKSKWKNIFPHSSVSPTATGGSHMQATSAGAENSKGPPEPSPSNAQQAGQPPRDSEVLGRELQGNGPQNCGWALRFILHMLKSDSKWLLKSLNWEKSLANPISPVGDTQRKESHWN